MLFVRDEGLWKGVYSVGGLSCHRSRRLRQALDGCDVLQPQRWSFPTLPVVLMVRVTVPARYHSAAVLKVNAPTLVGPSIGPTRKDYAQVILCAALSATISMLFRFDSAQSAGGLRFALAVQDRGRACSGLLYCKFQIWLFDVSHESAIARFGSTSCCSLMGNHASTVETGTHRPRHSLVRHPRRWIRRDRVGDAMLSETAR